jgi:peptidoglycan-associated lipoprotein
MGIPGPQLAVVSFGKEKPVCTQETESCWQQNRRAHVTAAP